MTVEPGSEENVEGLDYFYRDPHGLHTNGRTLFEDIIGEPEGAHSSDAVWRNAYKSYYIGRNCCYKLLTTVCAVPLAFCWGCQFAASTFAHIWYINPCCFLFNLNFSCVARFFATLVHCCLDPVFESLSLMFTRIYLYNVKEAEAYKGEQTEEQNPLKV